MFTRRRFIGVGALGASAYVGYCAFGKGQAATVTPPRQHLAAASLPKFVDALPLPPLLKPAGEWQGAPRYEVVMTQFAQKLHRDLPPTTLWGYNHQFPGPTLEVRHHQPVYIRWTNALPDSHLLHYAIDRTLPCAGGLPDVRTVPHIHGARVDSPSDGYPEYWFTPDGHAPANGSGGPTGNAAIYRYDNDQAAALLWYHDHASGITRLNVYAGLEGLYIVRDDEESALGLPQGPYELPLLIQDRMFNADGSLHYPVQKKAPIDGVMPDGKLVPPDTPGARLVPPVWIPEFFGDAMLVNGKVWPYAEVEPRQYRLRLLNGCNARFLNLAFNVGVSFMQIGGDGGLLALPVKVQRICLAPAERADVIVDFAPYAGQHLVMTNSAPAPYPMGGAENDPSLNRHMSQVMQFRVASHPARADSFRMPPALRRMDRLQESMAVRTRDLTLNELEHPVSGDPVAGLLGTLIKGRSVAFGWMEAVSEQPVEGDIEIWRLINLTCDSHPIHLHLVQFQILDSQALLKDEKGHPLPLPDPDAPRQAPLPQEAGWKDTVRVESGCVTRIIIPFNGKPGRYVWHCHILEHEDNDMMRPYDLLPSPGSKSG